MPSEVRNEAPPPPVEGRVRGTAKGVLFSADSETLSSGIALGPGDQDNHLEFRRQPEAAQPGGCVSG